MNDLVVLIKQQQKMNRDKMEMNMEMETYVEAFGCLVMASMALEMEDLDPFDTGTAAVPDVVMAVVPCPLRLPSKLVTLFPSSAPLSASFALTVGHAFSFLSSLVRFVCPQR